MTNIIRIALKIIQRGQNVPILQIEKEEEFEKSFVEDLGQATPIVKGLQPGKVL